MKEAAREAFLPRRFVDGLRQAGPGPQIASCGPICALHDSAGMLNIQFTRINTE